MILCDNCSPRKGCTADKNRTECRFYQPLTEQEYLQTCDTEQLIRFLLWYPNNVHGYPKPKMSIAEEEDAIREWLKQPHKPKE